MALGNKTSSISDLKDNYLINGDMRISQRGNYTAAPVPLSNGTYSIDRVRFLLVTNTATIQRMSSSLPEGFQYSIRATATSTAVGRVGSFQQIEDYKLFSNRVITFSAWVKSNSNLARIRIYDGISNFTSTPHSGNGAWEYLTVTCTTSNSIAQLLAATSITDATGVGSVSINSGDYIECTGLKLEFGSVATEFVPRSTAEELFLCQRYYEKSYIQAHYPGFGGSWSGVQLLNVAQSVAQGYLVGEARFKVPKRTNPSVTVYSFNNTANKVSTAANGIDLATVAFVNTSENSFGMTNNQGSTIAFTTISFHWVADAEY